MAANNGKLWKFTGSDAVTPFTGWVQIALGGVLDNAEMLIYREGTVTADYAIGVTALVVTGLPAVAAPLLAAGEKLYFKNNLRTDYYEYTIAAWDGGTNTITLEEPGLVFEIQNGWGFVVARPARINHGGGYAGGYAGALVIDGYDGTVAANEEFIIKSENVKHKVTTVSGGPPTTSIDTWKGTPTDPVAAGALQGDWAALNATDPIVFAQGQDMLFFCDGVGPIYGWKETAAGGTLQNLSALEHGGLSDGFNPGAHVHRATGRVPCSIVVSEPIDCFGYIH